MQQEDILAKELTAMTLSTRALPCALSARFVRPGCVRAPCLAVAEPALSPGAGLGPRSVQVRVPRTGGCSERGLWAARS